jgi:hypothetical protein
MPHMSSVPGALPPFPQRLRSIAAVAAALLAVAVLSAAYGVPASTQPSRSAPSTKPASAPASAPGMRVDITSVTLRPGEGKEIKLVMKKGARVKYSWATDRGVVNYDKHADSTSPPRDYYGYDKGKRVRFDAGVLVAAFDGSHGWFWRNRTKEVITVTLETEGDYLDIKKLE